MEVGHVAIESKTKNVLKTNDTNAIEIVFNDKQTVLLHLHLRQQRMVDFSSSAILPLL